MLWSACLRPTSSPLWLRSPAVSKARDLFEPFLHQLGYRLAHVQRRMLPIAMHLLQVRCAGSTGAQQHCCLGLMRQAAGTQMWPTSAPDLQATRFYALSSKSPVPPLPSSPQKDGQFLNGHDLFLKRVGAAYHAFIDEFEKCCRWGRGRLCIASSKF